MKQTATAQGASSRSGTRSKAAAVDAAGKGSVEKLDLIKLNKAEYVTPATPVLLTVKPADYLAIEGTGAPSGAVFPSRLSALYGMAFTIKMSRKAAGLGDYAVSRLETIYELTEETACCNPETWRWTILIRTPDFVTDEDLAAAVALLRKREKEGEAALVRRLHLEEGTCVQALHTGPYEREHETYERMRAFARTEGFTVFGQPHEIYISDPRHVEPENLKTILRLPVRRQ